MEAHKEQGRLRKRRWTALPGAATQLSPAWARTYLGAGVPLFRHPGPHSQKQECPEGLTQGGPHLIGHEDPAAHPRPLASSP